MDGLFTSKTPHFFKVLLEEAIQHGKLKIPTKFVGEYGSEISSPVFLKVPSGEIWKIESTKSDSGIWLQNGWSDFAKHHSLKLLDFVVFRYEGNSLFNVVIFDKSASEIKYPITNVGQSQDPTEKIEVEEQDNSVEILDSNERSRGKSPLSCPRRSTRKRKIHSNTTTPNSKARIHNLASESVPEGIKVTKTRGSDYARRQQTKQNRIRGKARDKALQRASSSFESRNPYFMVLMQPSFVSVGNGRYSLPIPVTFTREYLMDKLGKVLCAVDEKSWCMKLVVNRMEKHNTLDVKLCRGWMEFVRDNNLAVGDVCVFELVKSTKVTFKVTTIRRE